MTCAGGHSDGFFAALRMTNRGSQTLPNPYISHCDRIFIRKSSVFPDATSGKSDFVAACPDNSDSVAIKVGPTGRIYHTSKCEMFGLNQ
jgi:hypothetical protein